MDYWHICKKVIRTAKEAGSYINNNFRKISLSEIHFKDRNDLVSFVDVESEKMIISRLKKIVPGSVFLAEESASDFILEKDKPCWIIDPLDGTTNFLHGIPVYAVCIALWYKEQVRLGVVYDPVHKQCFYSAGENMSFMNDERIVVSNNAEFSDSLIATGFPYKLFDKLPQYMEVLSYFLENSRGVRRLGSAAIDLVYVACGHFDSFYEYNLNPWDVAAGAFIVQNAGGKVTDFTGGDDFLFGKTIIASNSLVGGKVQNLISEVFYT